MDRTERERAIRPERVKRLIYAGVSSALTIIAVWRAAVLLINNTPDAAIILGCVALWSLMRLDISIGEGRKE